MSKLQKLVTTRKKSLVLGGATFVCALGIGYIMQYGFSAPGQSSADAANSLALDVSDVTPTSSAAGFGELRRPAVSAESLETPPPGTLAPTQLASAGMVVSIPQSRPQMRPEPAGTSAEGTVTLAALEDVAPESAPSMPGTEAETGFACDVVMDATAVAGAQVEVVLTAPCHAGERVTLHHQGLMFTEVMGAEGSLSRTVPALAETALFIASFASGDGATAMTEVPTLPFYDRVAVQWKGDAGLGLHAREFAADYFGPGHIWAEATGDMSATARGEGGFLTTLGNPETPEALRAEIYTFPSGAAKRTGDVLLTVEAEITGTNCDQTVEAQTLEIRKDDKLRTRNLTLDMPGCDVTGDFLVLKNLVEDLTIAAR